MFGFRISRFLFRILQKIYYICITDVASESYDGGIHDLKYVNSILKIFSIKFVF